MNNNDDLPQDLECDSPTPSLGMRQLGRRRNHLCPLHRLPPEILGRIFELSLPKSDFPYPRHSLLSRDKISPLEFLRAAFKITSICHHWRTIALLSPSLWSHIVPAPEDCTIEMLSRSLGLIGLEFMSLSHPLCHDPEKSRILSLLIGSPLSRMRSLYLKVFDEDLHGIEEIFSRSVPELVSLALYFESRKERSKIPLITLLGPMPSLRRLSLRGIESLWSLPSLQSLTSLSAEYPWPTTFAAMFSALE
ncbi:hypothetical protein JAAARDRAFT_211456, partial [Jaapia argillacea MUCL 33604]